MLVKNVSFNDFLEEFRRYGRENQFSYDAKKALYDYLNDISEDTGEHIELDIISICCDFSEYDNLEQFIDDYGYTVDINSLEDIEYYTVMIPINEERFIIQNF